MVTAQAEAARRRHRSRRAWAAVLAVCAQLTEAVYALDHRRCTCHSSRRDSCLSTEDRHQSAATVKVVVERATVAVETARVVKMQMRTDPARRAWAAVLAVCAQLTEAVYAARTTVVAHAILSRQDSCLGTEDRHQSAATVKVVVERATVAVETAPGGEDADEDWTRARRAWAAVPRSSVPS